MYEPIFIPSSFNFFKNKSPYLLVFFLWAATLMATEPPLIFENISNKEGLNQNSIFSIIQDQAGFMWLGTSNGLIKHDGSFFTSYVPHPGDSTTLLSNLVLKVFEDSEETIWLGTLDGLCIYQPNQNAFIWIDAFNQKINQSIIFNQIYESSDHQIWLATSEGLFSIDASQQMDSRQFKITKITHTDTGEALFPKGTEITGIHELEDASFLIGTDKGLLHISKSKTGNFELLQSFDQLPKAYTSINKIFQAPDGLLWIGTNKGIQFLQISQQNEAYQYDWNKRPTYFTEELHLANINITSIFHDRNNHILIGTFQEGLFTYAQANGQIKNYKPQPENAHSIGSNVINDIFMDKSGVIWLATAHGGVSKIDPNRKPFFNLNSQYFKSPSISSDLVSGTLLDSKKRLWVGTFQDGINVSKTDFSFTDLFQTEFNHYLENRAIKCIYETADALVLIGTAQGLEIYDLQKEQFLSLNQLHPLQKLIKKESVQAITQIGNTIYFGGQNSLKKVQFKTDSRDLLRGQLSSDIYDEHPNSRIHYSYGTVNILRHDPDRGLWIGTRNGLLLLDDQQEQPKLEVFQYHPANDRSISNNRVFSIYKDPASGNIWVGTFGGGLNQLLVDPQGKISGFKRITQRDGLPDNAIYSILKDKNDFLWISTDEGIARLNTQDYTCISFNMEDGLPANNFRLNTYLALDNGIMIMGGLKGLTIFDPLSITKNPYPPRPIITNLKLLNESIYPNKKFRGKIILEQPIYKTKEITLPYNFNLVALEFGAMHYATPNKNSFQYMLEGVDNDWVSVDNNQHFANYSQLRPGNYLFKLKSFNGDGLESETIKTLKLTIKNPYYWTNLAFFIYFLLISIIGFFIYRYAHDMIQLRRRVAEEEREIQHIKEINEAKLKFFTDVSHEFRTPLTLIISPLETLLKDKKLHPDLKERISNINENGQKLLNLTNTLIDFRKVGQGKIALNTARNDLSAFVKITAKAFQDYAKDRQINFNVNTPENALIGWFDPAIIERVLFNLLSNAFKYTSKGGTIEVDLNLNDTNRATICVSDTGTGMSPKELNHIFDRFVHGEHKKSLFGTSGIGLSLVKNLIDLHQGKISVESTLNTGTRFYIDFPIQENQVPPTAPVGTVKTSPLLPFAIDPSEIKSIKVTPPTNHSIKTVSLLIIEDNPEIQKIIEDIFINDFIIFKASDGEEGLKQAIEHTPSIIISDVMMPNLDGFELSAKLKSDIRTSHIPLVLLSALNDFESKETGFKEGGDLYITKPFSPHLLELQINNLIRTKQKEAEFLKTKFLMEPNAPQIKTIEEVFLQTIKKLVEENYQSSDLNVEYLAQEAHMSYIQFYRKFKAITGINAKEYIRIFRLKKAAHILQSDGKKSVSEVMYSVGFMSQSYFTNAFKKQYKTTPAEYKKQFLVK